MLAHRQQKGIHFLLNHGISVTLRGTRRVEPFRPSADLEDLTLFEALETFSETFLAAALDFVAAFFDADLATDLAFSATVFDLEPAFFATDFVAEVALLAAVFDLPAAFLATTADFVAADLVALFALDAVFLAAPETFSAAFAAALAFLATAALRPASWSFFEPADATLEIVSIFALINFFAVAAPIPGSAVNFSIFEFPFAAIGSPVSPCGWNTSILLFTRFEKGLT